MKVRVKEGKHYRREESGLVRYSAGMEFDASLEELVNLGDRLEVCDEPKPQESDEDTAVVEEQQPVDSGAEKAVESEAEDPAVVGGAEVVEASVVSEPEPEANPTQMSKRSSRKKAE